MTTEATDRDTMQVLDEATIAIVRLAAIIAVGDESALRATLAEVVVAAPPEWVEEVVLQSYLFAGFPRALNAAREWRRISGRPAPESDEGERYDRADEWRERGEETCATVYGPFYKRLRANIRDLHPALDAWMIVDGYGKVLSRPGLDLVRRELCIVAVCAVAKQDRQLHSHLHGALHAGASAADVQGVLNAVAYLLGDDDKRRYRMLWERVLPMNAGKQ
jgi:4-carboxymuconolactone decarboxylase